MKIENHVDLLHSLEDGIVIFIRLDSAVRVCGYSFGIGLDAFVEA